MFPKGNVVVPSAPVPKAAAAPIPSLMPKTVEAPPTPFTLGGLGGGLGGSLGGSLGGFGGGFAASTPVKKPEQQPPPPPIPQATPFAASMSAPKPPAAITAPAVPVSGKRSSVITQPNSILPQILSVTWLIIDIDHVHFGT